MRTLSNRNAAGPTVPRQTVTVLLASLILMISADGVAKPTTDAIDDLIADLESIRTKRDIPAFALTLVDREQVLWSGARGWADRASRRAVNQRTRFRIGSISKMFTAVALLLLQQDGLLQLDTPTRAIVPTLPLRNAWSARHPVRVAHLLEHSAGLLDMSTEEFDYPVALPLDEALALKAAARRTEWPPGMHFSYSNVGPGLAAKVIETVSTTNYESFVTQRIFQPLGMTTATLLPDNSTRRHLATGYDSDGKTVIPYWHMLYRAFGAINAQPADMAPFIQMLLNNGRHRDRQFLTSADIERMETPSTTLAARSGLRFGYGLGNYGYLHRGVLFHGHGGDADGYLARLGYQRDSGLGYFLVINVFRNADLSALRNRVEDFITAYTSHPVAPPVLPLDPALAKRYSGHYQAATYRFPGNDRRSLNTLYISNRDHQLYAEKNSHRQRLLAVTIRHFRYPGETVATAAFVEDGDGTLFFQDDSGSYRRIGP